MWKDRKHEKRSHDKDEQRRHKKTCAAPELRGWSRANVLDDELIGFDCGKNCKVSNGGTRGHNSFMFVTVFVAVRVRCIIHAKQLLLAICQNPGNIDGDLFARKIRKPVPVAVYPFVLSPPVLFFLLVTPLSPLLWCIVAYSSATVALSKMHKLEVYWFSASIVESRRAKMIPYQIVE